MHKALPFFLCLSFLVSIRSVAQAGNNDATPSVYLFETFQPGTVLLKSGHTEAAPLNYDATLQGIAFEKAGTYFNLTALETIDTVYIGTLKFIPANGLFFECTHAAPIELFTTYSGKMQPLTATADNNGSSRKNASQVSNTVSDVYLNRPYRGDYMMVFRKQFWIRNYREFYKVNTVKQVIKVFPRKEEAILDFVKKNRTNFNQEEDVISLLRFCTLN